MRKQHSSIVIAVVLLSLQGVGRATVFTNTRPEIAQMAGSWEVDSVQISSLVTNQYPAFGTNTWEYIVPHGSQSGDGDLHINMAIDPSGTGATGNNIGASPIVAEIVNVSTPQILHLTGLNNHAKTRGIFRFYTEHSGERHFEIHPMTEVLTWNGSAFVLDASYRGNITNVSDGASHPNSTLTGIFDGSDVMTTTVLADNNRVTINSPIAANYVQYSGVALSGLTNDSVSSYFWFRPDLLTNVVPSLIVRCRIVTNTLAATTAAALFSNQTLTVNALTRTDMLAVSNQVAALSYPSNPSASFGRPVELITLGIGNTGVATLPIITGVQTTNVTGTAATALWTTDVPSDSRAIYGLTPTTVTNSVSGTGTVTAHTVNLTGLLASKVYYFDVSSASPSGRTTDDNQEQHYVFITAGSFDLPLTPANGFRSAGNPGGPFTPSNQVYNLSNTNASSASWGVTKTAIWLDVAPTNGLLATGNSTNITISINANADSLAAGSYSDFVVFRNLSSGSLTSRVVNLTVFPLPTLAVAPSSGFDSAGPPGGSFNPASQNYTLSNTGSNTLSWVAGKAANWLDLSATSGNLAPGASTTVTVSINTNANSLAESSYSDTVTFTNTTNGIGNTTRPVNLFVTSFGFYDDFSTFTPGNLVGQQSWTQIGVTSSLPLQVTGGKAAIPGGQIFPNQSAYKNIPLTNIAVFYGMSLSVTSTPPNTTAPPYVTGLFISNNATSFSNYRLSANKGDGANTNFVIVIRITGQGVDPFTAGTPLVFGTSYRVIIRTSPDGSNAWVYLNPSSSDLGAQTPYIAHPIGAGASPPPSVGSFDLQQLERNQTANSACPGVLIGKLVVADNFTTVYNDLLGTQPPVASFTGNPTSGTEPLAVTFAASTANITNWFWNFGDTTTTNTTTNSLVHVYAAGTYPVTLIVSGQGGSSTNVQPNYISVLTTFQSWQVQYFGSTNGPVASPSADPDGDGLDNLAEFLTGSNPTNSSSFFGITDVIRQGNDVFVSWMTGLGKTNALERSAGTAAGFSNNFAAIFTVTNTVSSTTNFLDLGAATNVPAFYYRIRLVP